MNKGIIGIYDGGKYNVKFDEKASCMGGSETWLKFIAKSLADLGYKVHLFVNAPSHKWGDVEIYSREDMGKIFKETVYTKFIWSRGIKHFKAINALSKAVMVHDLLLTDFGEDCYLHSMNEIFVLSDFSKRYFIKHYGQAIADKIKITFNGVETNLYKSNPAKKEKSMVWSSCWHRGLIFFIKYVLPSIVRMEPTFKLKVCSYCRNHKFDKYINGNKHIVDLGRLSKEDLAKEQCKAKIWVYPNLGYTDFGDNKKTEFYETFCISAVENGLAGNDIITTELGGFATTCKGIKFVNKRYYGTNGKIKHEFLYGRHLAELAVKAIRGTWSNKFDAKKFTWENAAKSLL